MDAGCRSLRDAEIYRKRQAGRTLRALAAEFGVSVEAIRGAEFREERRRQRQHSAFDPDAQLDPERLLVPRPDGGRACAAPRLFRK